MKSVKEIAANQNISFLSPYPGGARFSWSYDSLDFLVIATDVLGEDHVSISHMDLSIKPTLDQMIELVNIFFYSYEDVHLYMKEDGDELLVSNCYHIYRKQNELSTTFVLNPKKHKDDLR